MKSKQLLAKVSRATVPEDKSEYSQLPVVRYLNTALTDCGRCGVTRRYVQCTVKIWNGSVIKTRQGRGRFIDDIAYESKDS